ncbi:C40 family peptidase [uncultured Leifsonia sp.]|uniref:C40 family peptidase n=1 Tax=uncultured Leifsonia sp. TaxID=340359 RepID=UPI0025F262A8|nr:C40 family peptidase [uncultured Leifsonia sp.]
MAHSGTPDPAQDQAPQDPDITPSTSSTRSTAPDLVSRRSLRTVKASSSAPRAPKRQTPPSTSVAAATEQSKPAAKKRKGGWALNVAVMTVATGIIATMSIPAFAFNPAGAESSAFGPSAADSMKKAQAQSVEVSGGVAESAVSRDAATATSQQQLDAQKAAAAAEAARQRAAVSFASYAAYSGPSVSDFLANPPYPSFSLSQVFSVAKQYIGTPYVYGGASPAGFDCSGYVMYVYAQFGISLPHSVSGQAAMGKRISIQDAQPGDIVIMPGHDGFYAGNGNIMDAPDSGRSISIRPIWTSDFYIVRLGI